MKDAQVWGSEGLPEERAKLRTSSAYKIKQERKTAQRIYIIALFQTLRFKLSTLCKNTSIFKTTFCKKSNSISVVNLAGFYVIQNIYHNS